MSFEYFGKYKEAERRSTHPTIDEPVVVLLGMTIADLLTTVLSFLVMTLFFNAPFIGLITGFVCAKLRKLYALRFPRGTFLQWLWSFGVLKRKHIPVLIRRHQPSTFSP